jgi:hypothetical protein
MAVIEYEIHFGNGKPYVTTKVLEVKPGDKIRFKSNNASAGIEYKGRSPFDATDAPQPDKAFPVSGTTAEFDVSQHLTTKNRIEFDCGEIEVATGQSAIGSQTSPKQYKLKDRYTGEGTPNN